MITQTLDLNFLSESVDALIDGLRISDVSLTDKCMKGLCAVGPRVVPVLAAALQAANTAPHRRRIADAIDLIEDTGQSECQTARPVFLALLDCLRISDEPLNAKATEAISMLPAPMVQGVMEKATLHRRKKGYSQRLKIAASRLGLRRPD